MGSLSVYVSAIDPGFDPRRFGVYSWFIFLLPPLNYEAYG
jgi:hypothetical protein